MEDGIRIENVVGSTGLNRELDLSALVTDLPGADYDPDQFPGLIYQVHDPKATILIFRSGEIVVTGAQSEADIRKAIVELFENLNALGIETPRQPDPAIQNFVTSADLDEQLNLNAIAIGLGLENIEYEPEQFPGLVYRLEDPDLVVLMFGSGKLVITGGKQQDDATRALAKVRSELENLGVLG